MTPLPTAATAALTTLAFVAMRSDWLAMQITSVGVVVGHAAGEDHQISSCLLARGH